MIYLISTTISHLDQVGYMYLGTVLQFKVVCLWGQCYMRIISYFSLPGVQVYITIDIHVIYLDTGCGGGGGGGGGRRLFQRFEG